MNKILSIVTVLMFINQISFSQTKTITAKITGFKNGTKVRIAEQETQKHIDSSFIQNNSFVLKNTFNNNTPRDFSLVIFDSIPKFIRLFISKENITISGDLNDIPNNLKITGSKSQNEQNLLDSKTKLLQKEHNDIVKFWRTKVEVKDDKYQLKLKESNIRAQKIIESMDSISIKFINANPNSYVSLHRLSYLFEKYSRKDLQNLYKNLQSKFKKSDYGITLLNYISTGETIKENDFFADFEAFDKNDIKHKLSDFKGKYIVLDFTKEYCAPCEKAIKELKIIYAKYSDKITIISFNGEKSKEYWKKGLIRNNIPWLSLWDGQGNKGNTLLKYGVQGFPNFFLINKEGKIIQYIDGYTDGNLEPAVENLLQN